jgi:K+-transporting ATPase KdpF subunit
LIYFSFLRYIIKNYERFVISSNYSHILIGDCRADSALPAFNEVINMNILYLVSGIIAFALLVYLVIALLKPEWFK